MKKVLVLVLALALAMAMFAGCDSISSTSSTGSKADTQAQMAVANTLQGNQPTPTDIDYSLERYNGIRRAYWVNGQREKALALPCPVAKPLGYVTLFSYGTVVGSFVVDGKVSSLQNYLTPISEKYEQDYGTDGYAVGDGNDWLADVDGTYGDNPNGIYFFTPDGKYIEWTGTYLYTDIPFNVPNPVLQYQNVTEPSTEAAGN